MNLRNEFTKILETYGYPVLIIRQSKKLRCSCWNEKTQEADRKCPWCFGIGWNPIVEKHMARAQDMPLSNTLSGATGQAGFGNISIPSRQWFISPNAAITEKDLIVDVEWKENGKPVYNGGGIYEIVRVDTTLRYEQGELIFKKVYSQDTPIRKNIRGIKVVQINGIVNYELAMEDV